MTTCLNCGHESEEEFQFCPRCGTQAPELGSEPGSLLGRTLNDKYRITAEIGSGAMGTVYLGEHVGLKKKVALKVLHPDLRLSDEQLQRFQREGIAAGKFNHPNAIQIFDFDKAEDRLIYLAMEYVEGSNLRIYLRRKERLPVGVAVRLARQVLDCLAEAHRHGIVHRDLKPDNLMVVTASRGDVRVKVLDFGLSKLVALPGTQSSLVTQAGRLLGTPLYMSPEQAAGEETDARSDIYAVGLILFEMLTGKRPFTEESTSDLLFARTTQEAPSLRERFPELVVPEELCEILRQALARRREDRYQSAVEMLRDLEAIPLSEGTQGISTIAPPTASELGAGRPLRKAPPAESVPAPAAGRGRRWVLALSLVGVAAVVAGFLLVDALRLPVAEIASAPPARLRDRTAESLAPVEQKYLGLIDLARAGLRTGNPNGARANLNEALQLECVDSEAFLVQAEVMLALKDEDAAMASYREAARLDEGYVEAHLGLARLALGRDELEEAEAGLGRAAAALDADGDGLDDPRLAPVRALEGVLALRRDRPSEARTLFEQALTLDAREGVALLHRGRLELDAGKTDAAVQTLIQAKLADPSSEEALQWLAEAYVALARYDEAEIQYRAALELGDSLELRRALGTLLVDQQRFDAAVTFLEEALRSFATDPRLRLLLALAHHGAGDVEAAITAVERATELEAEPEAHLLAGLLYHRLDQRPKAMEHYRATIEALGDVPAANLGLGLALFEEGEHRAAAERFRLVLDYDPDDAAAHLHLGLLKKDYLGDSAGAREHFERYQALGGLDPRVGGWLRGLR